MESFTALRDVLIIFLLILLNGFFSMSEMALVASRRARLKAKADEGKKSYRASLVAAQKPGPFLSTIQIGITLIGTLSGAFGGSTIAGHLARLVALWEPLRPYAPSIGMASIVILITLFSIVLGELLPKQVALTNPEAILSSVVSVIRGFNFVFRPVERFLSAATALILKALRIRRSGEPEVTEEEIRVMVQEGSLSGSLGKREGDMVENVFYLGERQVSHFARHRSEMAWVDEGAGLEEIKACLRQNPGAQSLAVCLGGPERVIGTVNVRDLLLHIVEGNFSSLAALTLKAVFVPESMTALKAFEAFKRSNAQGLIVLDEYGDVEGSLGIRDLVEEVVGELSLSSARDEPAIVDRGDGSYLVDGLLDIDGFREHFGLDAKVPESRDFHTLAGFVLSITGSIPRVGERLSRDGMEFEVVDMDHNRIDKLLFRPPQKEEGPTSA